VKKYITVALILIVIIVACFAIYKFIVPTYADTYTLKGDYIPSIKTVLKETRIVSKYETSNKNNVIFKKYEYGYQENVIEDLKTYTNYLIQMEQFEPLKDYDLSSLDNSSIYLGKKSHIDEEYIILVNIDYTSSSYTISISKKKGTILE